MYTDGQLSFLSHPTASAKCCKEKMTEYNSNPNNTDQEGKAREYLPVMSILYKKKLGALSIIKSKILPNSISHRPCNIKNQKGDLYGQCPVFSK